MWNNKFIPMIPLKKSKNMDIPDSPSKPMPPFIKKILYGQRYYQDSISIEDIADVSLTA